MPLKLIRAVLVGGRSLHKHQTPHERGNGLLQQDGAWLAAHVAMLDFKKSPVAGVLYHVKG